MVWQRLTVNYNSNEEEVYMAYSVLVERTLAAPRAKVFAALMDFGGINKLLPDAIESCTLEGQGIDRMNRRDIDRGRDLGIVKEVGLLPWLHGALQRCPLLPWRCRRAG